MSCQSSNVYGYGFQVEDLTMTKTFSFIKNHLDTLKHIVQSSQTPHTDKFLIDCQTAWDLLMVTDLNAMAAVEPNGFDYDTVYDQFTDLIDAWEKIYEDIEMYYLRDVITAIINDETGLGIEYQSGQDDCGSVPSILMAECLPWHLTPTERTLTCEDDFANLLKPYITELGYTTKSLDHLSIEYYG